MVRVLTAQRPDTTDSSGNWSVSLTSDEVKALDASTPAAGGETITITASATDASNGTATFIYDPVAPTATLTPGSIGGNENGTNVYLGTGDKVTVNIAFSEGVSTAPTVQMKNDSANLGSAITATARSAYDSGSLTTSANQTKTPESAVLWDSVSEVGVITTKTASFGGTLLETQSPLASLRLRVTIPSQGNYQTLRYKDGSDPSSWTDGTAVTPDGGSWSGATFNGDATINNVPAGRRYWWGSGNTNNITLGSRTLQINAFVC